MTKEQEEVIKLAKEFTKMDFSNPMGWTGYYDTELKELQECIKIVLNMLEEKDKEIDFYKKGLEREIESNRDNIMEIIKQDKEIEKKDKMIDLYIDELVANEFDRCCQECCRECEKDKDTLRNCTKQYFEKKIEAEGE